MTYSQFRYNKMVRNIVAGMTHGVRQYQQREHLQVRLARQTHTDTNHTTMTPKQIFTTCSQGIMTHRCRDLSVKMSLC